MTTPPDKLSFSNVALFLDVDGTLLEIANHPQDVAADAELVDRLEHISTVLDGAIALISGRSIVELDRVFSGMHFAAAGEHGAEMRLKHASLPRQSIPDLPGTCLSDAERFASENEGVVLEKKAAGLSLHYRQAPQAEAAARALVDSIMAGIGTEFRLIEGKMVLEIAPQSHNKGEAVRKFLENEPFRNRQPVFVGDDVTDEDGFRAVNDLGGISIRVGQRPDSEAAYVLANVSDVHLWLTRTFVNA